jgi:hypothetical protein
MALQNRTSSRSTGSSSNAVDGEQTGLMVQTAASRTTYVESERVHPASCISRQAVGSCEAPADSSGSVVGSVRTSALQNATSVCMGLTQAVLCPACACIVFEGLAMLHQASPVLHQSPPASLLCSAGGRCTTRWQLVLNEALHSATREIRAQAACSWWLGRPAAGGWQVDCRVKRRHSAAMRSPCCLL